ncbi:MAG TPA: hypothetical protein VLJ58_18695, partial [Ramlibacter sp.]|nr:hypothetical protein [Ramlibacter sp.]
PIKTLDDESVHEVEAELARHIGPLAPVLVRKARPLAGSVQALREALAPLITEPKGRELFLNPAPHGSGHSQGQPQHRSRPGPGANLRPMGSSRSVPGNALSGAPTSQSIPVTSRPSAAHPPSQPASAPLRSGPSTASRRLDLSEDELDAVEQTLSRFIGPMARMLVRKELLGNTGGFKPFVAAVAATVDRPDQREAFLQALKRALPKRSF